MRAQRIVASVLLLFVVASSPAAAAPTPRQRYEAALARERTLRAGWNPEDPKADLTPAMAREGRAIVVAYEGIVRRSPTSGYCDNALWQAAQLSADLSTLSHEASDRQTAIRLLEFLAREYPASSFAARAAVQARRLQSTAPANAPNTAKSAEASARGREAPPNAASARRGGLTPASTSSAAAGSPAPGESPDAVANTAVAKTATPAAVSQGATIREIRRTVLPEVVRVSIEMDREVVFHEERVENPPRLLFDLASTKAAAALQDANWTYKTDVVRRIRVGRHPNETTRVVLDLEGVSRYTVVTVYNPYRILIDCERAQLAKTATEIVTPSVTPPPENVPGSIKKPAEKPKKEVAPKMSAALPADKGEGGRVSMARQLGLGVSRIVIDPGHGGHDPGAEGPNMSEADIVLDIGLRLEKALARQPGIDVVLTRRTDVFVPLEERTRIANREQADLFLSIHANASHNQSARGIESYYLNFASNPDAEAVAARENAASERTMNSLTDIVKAITLNNKLDESKDFASLVQQAMARRLKPSNNSLKNLGVKQAPFVVLIGAAMPSVLAEVSFVTNRREGQLLATEAYRQRIADALADAVVRYRRTLKTASIVASGSSR